MSTAERNIVILFDETLTQKFIKLSKNVNAHIPSKIVLNNTDQIPHLTLYMTKYPERNIQKVVEKISRIAQTTKPFQMKLIGKSCHASGTLFIDAEMSVNLYRLHEKLVDRLNPLREGLFNEEELTVQGMTEKNKKMLIEYSMWAVKNDYLPHISVARVYNPAKDRENVLKLLPETIQYQTTVQNIAFVVRGPNGTCNKILQKFELMGK